MSIRVMTRVWDGSTAKWGDLLLLLAIADSAHDDGVAYPTVCVLAAKSRMTRRGVQKAVARLVGAGELAVGKRPGRYGTNAYRVLVGLPAAGEGRTMDAPEGRTTDAPEGRTMGRGGANTVRPSRGELRTPHRSVKAVVQPKQPEPVKAAVKTGDGASRQGPGCPVNDDDDRAVAIARIKAEAEAAGAGASPRRHGQKGLGRQGAETPGGLAGDGPTEAETREAIARVRKELAQATGNGDLFVLAASGLPVIVARELVRRWPGRVRPAIRYALPYAERELARGHTVNLPGVIRAAIERGWRTSKPRKGM